jgi:hypothetical protein
VRPCANAKLGWRVHPCRPGGKLPILVDWPNRATTDPTLIERWWGRAPDANVAVATGHQSGLLTLDIDGPEGEQSLADLEARHGPLPEFYPLQYTGGGRDGWQAFFAYPAGRQIGNSAGKLGPKLDTRGEGGYVLVPPSVTTEAYRWATDRDPWSLLPDPFPPAPDWLVDLLDPQTEPKRGGVIDYSNVWRLIRDRDDRYLLRVLEAELALVASAPNGRRNQQLNESAFALFRFAVEGRLEAGAIAHGLEAAARHAGLNDREAIATIRSAARARGIRL